MERRVNAKVTIKDNSGKLDESTKRMCEISKELRNELRIFIELVDEMFEANLEINDIEHKQGE